MNLINLFTKTKQPSKSIKLRIFEIDDNTELKITFAGNEDETRNPRFIVLFDDVVYVKFDDNTYKETNLTTQFVEDNSETFEEKE